MWGAAPTGDFKYSDLSSPQQGCLFEEVYDEEYAQQLANQIYQNCKGKRTSKNALIQNELAWHPLCVDRHLRRALIILEYESTSPRVVKVELPGGRKRREKTYPEGCTITFSS